MPVESSYSTFGFTDEETEGQRREVIAQTHTAEFLGRTRDFLGAPTSSSPHFSNSGLSCN